MASVITSGVPGALENASLASDSYGGNQQATTAGAIQNGETVPFDGAVADVARAPDASATPRRSIASLGFPSAPPDYDARPKRGYLAGAPARPPAPPDNTAASTTTGITANTTTASPSGVRTLRSALRPAGPNPARRSSERAPVRGRREAESYDALAMENQLQAEITAVEEQVSRVVQELEHVQRAIRSDEPYYGKDAVKLAAEEKWLVRKEQLLREKEGHLREERLELIRSRSDQRRRASEGDEVDRRMVNFLCRIPLRWGIRSDCDKQKHFCEPFARFHPFAHPKRCCAVSYRYSLS